MTQLNVYTRIIVDEACRRGITVDVIDPGRGALRLSYAGRVVHTIESLSELTSAVAFRMSKVTGAPSRLTTGGPSKARRRSVAAISETAIPENRNAPA